MNTVRLTVDTNKINHPSTGGFGFQFDAAYLREFNTKRGVGEHEIENVYAKRWKELAPGMARFILNIDWWEREEGVQTWDSEPMRALYRHLDLIKSTNTIAFPTVWYYRGGTPPWLDSKDEICVSEETQRKFARTVVDALDYLITVKGYDNIKYFCISNELGGCNKGGFLSLEEFKGHNVKIMEELKSRGKEGLFGLAGTDQSADWDLPDFWDIIRWDSLVWAAQNMDECLALYDGHMYMGYCGSKKSYANLEASLRFGADLARKMGKDFIIGEFGPQFTGGGTWLNPQKDNPDYGILLAEYAIAMLNSGTYTILNWIFADMYYSETTLQQWGLMHDATHNFTARPSYYSYGLFCKYFRPDSRSFQTKTEDEDVRIGAVCHNPSGQYSIAAVSRKESETQIHVSVNGDRSDITLRRYIYNPKHPPFNPNADLPPPTGTVQMKNGMFTDVVPEDCLVIYTSV